MKGIDRIYFDDNDLSERAYSVYINSDLTFYREEKSGVYYAGLNHKEDPVEIGNLPDVEKYLISFDENEMED